MWDYLDNFFKSANNLSVFPKYCSLSFSLISLSSSIVVSFFLDFDFAFIAILLVYEFQLIYNLVSNLQN